MLSTTRFLLLQGPTFGVFNNLIGAIELEHRLVCLDRFLRRTENHSALILMDFRESFSFSRCMCAYLFENVSSMSQLRAIKSVVEAEREAKKIVEDAKMKERDMRRELEKRAKEKSKEILSKVSVEVEKMIEEARSQGEREAAELMNQSAAKLKSDVERASRKKTKAVEALLEKLTKWEAH